MTAPLRALPLLVLLAAPVHAQVPRPGEERPPTPELAPEEGERPRVELPPIPPAPRPHAPLGARTLRIDRLELSGNTMLSDQELHRVAAPWLGRPVAPEELAALRDALTRHYIDSGYVTSGATLPDQVVSDGTLRVVVVEGVLSGVAVETSGRLRESFLRDRLAGEPGEVVNVYALERRIALLQETPVIERIDARLEPGERRGESRLFARVVEGRAAHGRLVLDNGRPPSVGSFGSDVFALHHDLTGRGDRLVLRYGRSQGVSEWDAAYRLPLTVRDLALELRVRRSPSDVVEDPFDEIDIESDTITYSLDLSHPLWREPDTSLRLGARGELRRADSYLAHQHFSFSQGPEDGQSKLSVLRLYQDWWARSHRRVLAARSTLSLGFDVFDATDDGSPDGTFVTWLGQAQWVERLPERYRHSQLIVRADAQLSFDPLLSLERFGLGGFRTVRGYRENQLVRDNAWVASAELRIPLLRTALGRELLEVAPFFDIGQAWNHDRTRGPRTLASLGLGLRWHPSERLSLAAYWGGRLRHVRRIGEDDLQDHGFHLRAELTAF